MLRQLDLYQNLKLTVVRDLVTRHVFCFALASGKLKVKFEIIVNNCTKSPIGFWLRSSFLLLPLP